METEIWKDVIGYEGYYQVSNTGRIKSMYRKVRHSENNFKIIKERIIKSRVNKHGYIQTILRKQNISKTFLNHRIVAMCFILNKTEKPCINHINGIKTDNRVGNLEWCNYSENGKHSYKLGLSIAKKGVENNLSKLNENQITFILKNKNKIKQKDIAKMFNVHQSTISLIQSNKTYKNINR